MIDRKSRLNYFIFHLSNPLIIFVRNILMRYLVKNKKFINNYLGKIYKN
jgi:salicylate hydroxylase